jgi:hypothetical protein
MKLVVYILHSALALAIPFSRLSAQPAQDSCTLYAEVLLMESDPLGHVYVANPQNKIWKADHHCRILYEYTNNYLGLPARIDAGNPINVLIYYPDQLTVVTLDVTMNEISRTSLLDLGYLDIRAVCGSNDGNIWILDGMDFTLKKIQRNGKVMAQSENLMLLLGRLPETNRMQESLNRVFVLDKNNGIHQFDNFANYKTTIKEPKAVQFQASQGRLIVGTPTEWIEYQAIAPTLAPLQLHTGQVLPLLIHAQSKTQYRALADRIQIIKYP